MHIEITIQELLFTILILFVLRFIHQQLYIPYMLYRFYKDQGMYAEFVPFISTFSEDKNNISEKGDYYAKWLKLVKQEPRPKMMVRNIGNTCMLMLFDPTLIKELFIMKDDFIKHKFQNSLMKILSPNGLVLLQYASWRKHRKVISKGFSYDRIDSLLPNIRQFGQVYLNTYKINKINKVKAFNFFKQAAGSIIAKTYFHEDLDKQFIDGTPFAVFLSQVMAQLSSESYSLKFCLFGMNLVKTGIFQSHRTLIKKVMKVRERVREIFHKHLKLLKEEEDGQKMFNMWLHFLQKSEDNQINFSENEIIDEFITFFSDGVYTTGHFLHMFIYFLCKNVKWKDALKNQICQNFTPNCELTQEKINNLPILSACVKETLRLAPPVVTGIQREATKDTVFNDGTKVKKGTMLMACHVVNHLDERFHDNPLEFMPERWMSETKTMKSIKQFPASYIPFSIGERNCPGQKFAMAEGSIFLAHFIQSCDFKLSDPNYEMKWTQRFLRQPLQYFEIDLKWL